MIGNGSSGFSPKNLNPYGYWDCTLQNTISSPIMNIMGVLTEIQTNAGSFVTLGTDNYNRYWDFDGTQTTTDSFRLYQGNQMQTLLQGDFSMFFRMSFQSFSLFYSKKSGSL